jgi:Leucine-rich repeat (LRR) protein
MLPLAAAAALLLQPQSASVFVSAKKEVDPAELERSILRELYEATNGHAWNENTGWAHDTPDVCTWTGIECLLSPYETEDGSNGDVRNPVIGIYLGDNFLSGRTPASLWKLPELRTLDLSYNPALDVDFGSLADKLDNHDKDSTETVVVPPLENINVRQTGTTSAKGVAALANTITKLVLSDCKFESQFPPDLLELRKLDTLGLSGCSLRGSLPDGDTNGISKLSQLRVFDVYDNDLTGTLPEGLADLVHLRSLILSKNQFHGKVPSFVNDELVMLEQFWINFNDFTGTIPAFDKQPSISKLYLNGNSFTGEIPTTFLEAALTGPEGFATSEDPIMVNLGKNEFSGIIPASLDRLSLLPITFRFGGNAWTGVAPELCDNTNWNEGMIEYYGCQGLICPPYTYSAAGYYTDEDPCEPCSTSDYFGTFDCFEQDDRAVLMNLYAKLGGEKWIHNEGWKDAPRYVADDDYSGEWFDYCDWYGVECWDLGDAKDKRVRRIILSNNNLVGTMPETIFSIEHMTTLDVSNNLQLVVSFRSIGRSQHIYSVNVGGTQTKDFDGIQHANDFFKRLQADNTPIAGTLPSEITRIHNLEVLSLQECQMNGELPNDLFAMSSLQELYLTQNNFQGVLPDKWASLVDLQVLSLAKNAFRGVLPESFGYSPSLRAITLKDQVSKGGGLSGSLPSFRKSMSLSQLILADNKLEGTLPEDLLMAAEGYARDEELNTLFHVDLTNNKITGNIHGSYERFSQLDLYLEGNLISSIDERLCTLPNPSWMSGGVGAYGCEAILCPQGTYNHGGRRKYMDDGCLPCENNESGSLSYLGQISCGFGLDDPALSGVDPLSPEASAEASAATAAASQSMERAVLESLFVSTGGPDDQWKSSNGWKDSDNFCTWYGIDCDENGSVASIQLGSNGLKGSLPASIWTLPNLVHLKIYGNQIDVDFGGIEIARNLQTLGLDDTGLKSLDGISKARSVTKLNVAYNNLAGNLSEELSKLVNLESLDISHNKIIGVLPFWLRNFVSLTSFSASHNNLEGQVPDFATLLGLVYLDLSHNKLGGILPTTLLAGSMPGIKIVVDLSHNQIEGIVPGELGRSTRLSIELQENKITGIDGSLCNVGGWNDFGVMSFGCDGILCPTGTWNSLGRQSSEGVPCATCKKGGAAKYMGATTCGSSTTTISSSSSRGRTSGGCMAVALLVGLVSAALVML